PIDDALPPPTGRMTARLRRSSRQIVVKPPVYKPEDEASVPAPRSRVRASVLVLFDRLNGRKRNVDGGVLAGCD
ncbi:hypothetical protein, partial [Xanthobacter versatilis]|uniref:hypothetical protein n=2 Tax=Xanthobacter autotrophicus (strain ATCC BAA-1158 / Py2) TaxID=78245 RepID=UPI003727E860